MIARFTAPAFLAGFVLASTAAFAQAPAAPPAMQAVEKACADEIAKFCKDVQPGGGRIGQCLKAHKADLSMDCKMTLVKAKKEAAAASAAH
jgi:Cysteine rich repeat